MAGSSSGRMKGGIRRLKTCALAVNVTTPPLVYFMAIDKARFRRPVFPGDIIFYHIKKMRGRGRVWRFRAQAIVNSTLVAEAEISAVLVEEERR